MSRLYDLPEPSEINYHEARQQQRVEAAKRLIDVGDVIAIVEDRLAQEADPRLHPLFSVINFLLDRQTAVDGGAFWSMFGINVHGVLTMNVYPEHTPSSASSPWSLAPRRSSASCRPR